MPFSLRQACYKMRPARAAELPQGGFRRAFEMWLAAKAERELPPIGAVDPLLIPKEILPDCSLVSIEDGPKRFLVRLTGTRVVLESDIGAHRRYGEDIENGEEICRACSACVDSRWPIFLEGPATWSRLNYKLTQSLLMPYAADDGSVRRILSYIQFVSARAQPALSPLA